MDEKINEKQNQEQLKILELIDAYYPNVDGAISVAKNFTNSLSKKVKCLLAVPKPAKKSNYKDQENFEVIRTKSTLAPEGYRLAFPEMDAEFCNRILGEDLDIMHAHSPFSMGRFAIKMAKKKKIPVVATLHTQYHQDFLRVTKSKALTQFMVSYIMEVYNKADSVWTVSEASKKYLRDYGYKGKIEVVRNGTDLTYPKNADELVENINVKHQLKGQKNVFLFVGRMAWYKNLRLLIDSLKIIKDKGIDFKMIFVGGGFDYKEVYEYAEETGVMDRCIFTDTVTDKQLIQGYYLRADLFLLPSTFDMAPITKEEAAVHKLPCVVVEGSCSAERVVDGENGYVSKETKEDFANIVIQTCKDDEARNKVGENAYATLYRSWDMVGEEVIAKYREIIKEYKEKQQQKARIKKIRKQKEKGKSYSKAIKIVKKMQDGEKTKTKKIEKK